MVSRLTIDVVCNALDPIADELLARTLTLAERSAFDLLLTLLLQEGC